MLKPAKDCLGVFACFLLIYAALFSHRVLMDIPAQMYTLRQVCNGEVAMPPTALFYGLGWVFALGQHQSKIMLGIGAGIACAGLLTARWWLTRWIFRDYLDRAAPNAGKTVLGWLTFSLAFVCSLPTPDWWSKGWYIIGQPSPNYWMNGTLLASWPFALLLFWQSYRQLLRPERTWAWWMLLWLLLLVVSKPSYALVFSLVYPLFLIGRHGLGKAVRGQLWPFLVLAGMLLLEFYLVFWASDSVYVKQFNHGQQSGVSICVLCVWSMFSSNIGMSVLASVLFPLGVAVLFWQFLRKKLLFWYAWAGFGAALAISATFAQTGEEITCWNFRWQTYISSYLLFLVSVLLLWEKWGSEAFRWNGRFRTGAILFALHLLSGLVYLGKMWYTQSHY